jgi:membrane-associated protease RseP (regulator of RpoE activity)
MLLTLIAGIATPCVVAAQTGSISGKVTDKDSKQPVEAVSIIVDGTSYGVLTKANGIYTILGVPPGTYDVTAKRVGYQQVTAQNVVVRADISRTQDFELGGTFQLIPLAPTSPRVAPTLAAAASAGPGAAFGIDAYDCANCGIARYRDSVHAVYTFGAEPVVVAVSPQARDRIRPGDVIVAVNGNPITTRAGADMFAYPDSGEVKLTLRRNGTNIDVTSYSLTPRMSLNDAMVRAREIEGRGGVAASGGAGFGRSGGVGGARVGGGGRGGAGGAAAGGRVAPTSPVADSALRARLCAAQDRGTDDSTARRTLAVCPSDTPRADSPQPVRTMSSRGGVGGGIATARSPGEPTSAALATSAMATSNVELRNFGFTLSCRPDCTRARSGAGVAYWKFDGYPTVAVQSLAKDGIAAKVGIHEGDVLVSVNGLSPLSEEGAVLLNRTDRELELTLEFSRGGKREKYVLKL